MAQNLIAAGESIEYLNGTGSAINSGDVVIVGSTAGIAAENIAIGEKKVVFLGGAWTVPKATPLVISQGDELFWNTGTKKVTKTATDKPIGIAFEAAGSTDGTVIVLLHGNVNSLPQAANVAAIATANATDLASAQALANANKTATNAILVALKNAGIMVAD